MSDQLVADDIVSQAMGLDLPEGEYAICGGAVLAIHGLRATADIDMVVTPRIYGQFQQHGWREKIRPDSDRSHALLHGVFDMATVWSVNDYQPDPQNLIQNAVSTRRLSFVRLEEVLKWKRACQRPKDVRDVELIEAYLSLSSRPE